MSRSLNLLNWPELFYNARFVSANHTNAILEMIDVIEHIKLLDTYKMIEPIEILDITTNVLAHDNTRLDTMHALSNSRM
jgi:hypothetical protein